MADLVMDVIGCLLVPKLGELLKEEYNLQTGLKERVTSLTLELEGAQAELREVAKVPWDQLDEHVKLWARDVRDSSYDMEDVLDTFLVRVQGREPADMSRLIRAMKKMGNLFSKAKVRRDIASKIEDIKKKLQEAEEQRARYKVDETLANKPAAATSVDPRLSALYTKASQLVGIDEPRDALIKMLSLGEDGDKEMKIVSIVGFGGLGKTTLAKAVHDKVNPQFNCAAFVPVGRNPDPRKVLRDILIDLINDTEERKAGIVDKKRYTGHDLMGLDERQLINEVRKFLEAKRYFIVVDDIWDTSIWGIITNAFVDSNQGSRIMATSRNSQVSEEIGQVYRIKELSDSDSRKLLYTRIFGGEDKWPDNEQVAEVAQKILSKCHGVPLAIITISSLLASKHIEEWTNVYNSIGFGHGDNTQVKNMNKILSFSYYDLPCHLRTCMLCLSVFPEDYLVNKQTLLWQWIAQDLVQKKEGKTIFEVADSYFHELINRGMVLPFESQGIIYGCRVHDLVLHMIREKSTEEKFCDVKDNEKEESQRNGARRLALHRTKLIEGSTDMGMPQLRSFIAISCLTNMNPPVSGFQLLRVLALVDCSAVEGYDHIEHIGKLLHLRYLDLSYTPTRELPKEIGNLKFLQTLILYGTGIEVLPRSLGQLTELMCLRADLKTRVPDWIGKLTSLVELEMYPTTEEMFFVKELGKLRELKLLRTWLDVDEGQARDLLESLSNMKRIEIINVRPLEYYSLVLTDAFMQPSLVLSNTLQMLCLRVFEFSRLPKVINPQALPYLYSLSLKLVEYNQQDMEIIGKFEKLSFLDISCFNSRFSRIIIPSDGFQNLKTLDITVFQLKFAQGAMPSLEVIRLHISVVVMKDKHLSLNFGLGNLSSLQRFRAFLHCSGSLPTEVEEIEAELRHIVNTHPNRPTLEIIRFGEAQMLSLDPQMSSEEQKQMIEQRFFSQWKLYRAMEREAVGMDKLKENYLDVRDANNKVQQFLEQYNVTYGRVLNEIGPVCADNTPGADRNLSRLTEHIAALQRALVILTVENPRLTVMLEELRTVFSLQQGAMPAREVVDVHICVRDVKADNVGLDFGLGNLSSVQGIKAHIDCYMCFPTEAEEVEAALRHAVDIHPNRPALEIIRYWENEMVDDSDSIRLLERQKLRAERLQRRINHQKELYDAMSREAVEMGKLKTDSNPSDDAKLKVQLFLEQFSTTVARVPKLREDVPIRDHDLNSVAEDIAAKERALRILTIEYPRFVAMLDELRYVFGLQGDMPRLEVINFNICARDVKIDNLCLDNRLGNMSSLQGIKAHIDCYMCFPTELDEVEALLRNAVDIHPNRPALEIIRYWEDEMVDDSDSVKLLERQNLRGSMLWGRITYQKNLYDAMERELKSNLMNIRRDAKQKVLQFFKQYKATADHVNHVLLPVQGDTSNRDLNRVTEDCAAMERALQILTVENQLIAAILEELRTAFSLKIEDDGTANIANNVTEENAASEVSTASTPNGGQ